MAPKVRFSTLVAGVALLLQPALCQQGGQGGGAQTGPPAGGGGANIPPGGGMGGRQPSPYPGTQPGQQPGQYPNQFPEMQRPIFLSGKVVLDDGTPPPETVVIERVCNGSPRPEAYTDSKGRFSFELGKNQAMFADASVPTMGGMDGMGGMSGSGRSNPSGMGGSGMSGRGGIGERDLMGCDLRAVLPGYRSEMVSLANHRAFDNPDVGTILLHRLGNVEGRVISATSLNAPKDARKAFEKGQDLVRKKKLDEAAQSFQKAVDAYPKYAAAWYELGHLQEQQGHPDDARKSYQQSIAADGKYLNPHLQLSLIAARQNNWQDLADSTAKAIKLDPFDYPQAYFYNAVANYNLKNIDAAEKSAREAQKLDGKHQFPKVDQLLGIILADRQDYAGAAEQMRSYLKFAPSAQDAPTVRNQLTELERLAGGGPAAQPQQPQ